MAGGGIKINNTTIRGGADGATFTPSVDNQGNLSWTNDKGYPNPPTVNIRGATLTVNPTETPTAQLTSIKIDGVVYSLSSASTITEQSNSAGGTTAIID